MVCRVLRTGRRRGLLSCCGRHEVDDGDDDSERYEPVDCANVISDDIDRMVDEFIAAETRAWQHHLDAGAAAGPSASPSPPLKRSPACVSLRRSPSPRSHHCIIHGSLFMSALLFTHACTINCSVASILCWPCVQREEILPAPCMTARALVDFAAEELLKSLSETVEQLTDMVDICKPTVIQERERERYKMPF